MRTMTLPCMTTALLLLALSACGEEQALYSPCENSSQCDTNILGEVCVVDPYGGGTHFCSGSCRVDYRSKNVQLKVGSCYDEIVSEGGGERSDCREGCCHINVLWDTGQWGTGFCVPFGRQ